MNTKLVVLKLLCFIAFIFLLVVGIWYIIQNPKPYLEPRTTSEYGPVRYRQVCIDGVIYLKTYNNMTPKYLPTGSVATCLTEKN